MIATLDKKLALSGIEREFYWHGGDHEVTFAIHLETLRVWRYGPDLGGAKDWKAAFNAEWLTGTIDYLTPRRVDDLKTGRWPVDPATSRQLRSYALLPWVEAGCPIGWDIEVSVTQWEKYPLHGLPRVSRYDLGGMDLMEHLEDLRWTRDHPAEVNPTSEGCMFCDCKPGCPAWVDGDAETDGYQGAMNG